MILNHFNGGIDACLVVIDDRFRTPEKNTSQPIKVGSGIQCPNWYTVSTK